MIGMGASTVPVTQLPDLPRVSGVDYPADNPATPGETFAPPVSGGAIGSLKISEITRFAEPNQTLGITGDGWDSSTYFKYFGRDGTLFSDSGQTRNLLLNGNLAAVALPPTLPSNSAYMVWAASGANVSLPVLINKAMVWWTQDTGTGKKGSAIALNTISIHGINLCNATPATSIYLQPLVGTGGFVTATSVSAHGRRVQFTMPSTIGSHGAVVLNDVFEVWLHGLKGGVWGWSKCPINITVTTLAALQINYTVGSQQTMPAASGSSTSAADTTAVNARRDLISGDAGTINFLAGTYHINSTVQSGGFATGVKWKGHKTAGVVDTIIKPVTSGYVDAGQAAWIFFNQKGMIEDIEFDTTGTSNGSIGSNGAVLCSRAVNAKITSIGNVCLNTGSNPGIVTGVTLIGGATDKGALFDNTGNQQYVDNVTIQQSSQADAAINYFFSADCVSLTNITCTQYTGDPGHGRILVAEFSISNTYMDVLTSTLAPIINQNRGEQIFIGESAPYSSSTGWTQGTSGGFTTLNQALQVGSIVGVIAGKGIGQTGQVKASGGGSCTLDKLWKVSIDSGSRILNGVGPYAVSITNASITGGGFVTGSASTGIQIYSLAAEVYADIEITVTNCMTGVSVGSWSDTAGIFSACFWSVFKVNAVNCTTAEKTKEFYVGGTGGLPIYIGVVMRGVTCSDTGGTMVQTMDIQHEPNDLIIHDSCAYRDAPSGMKRVNSAAGTAPRDIWWNTTMIPGNAEPGTTVGIDPTNSLVGTNILMNGTSAISGFDSGNKP